MNIVYKKFKLFEFAHLEGYKLPDEEYFFYIGDHNKQTQQQKIHNFKQLKKVFTLYITSDGIEYLEDALMKLPLKIFDSCKTKQISNAWNYAITQDDYHDTHFMSEKDLDDSISTIRSTKIFSGSSL